MCIGTCMCTCMYVHQLIQHFKDSWSLEMYTVANGYDQSLCKMCLINTAHFAMGFS